ncbi:D-isomer specific 2-hydroxyacid dehydrogenase [Earliella scabrosa]|nr:D-isomer specific 2-hydroxyacid dehydrogenase [Earliella scabrosa]
MSTKLKVVVTRDLGPDVMPLLLNKPELDAMWPHNSACDRKWLLENAPGASGLLVMLSEKLDAELFDAAGPSLRVVSTMSVGYEHADLKELSKRGIRFGYTPDVLTDAVADVCIMLALMAGRNAKETTDIIYAACASHAVSIPILIHNRQWPSYVWSPFSFCGPQLSATPTSPKRTAGFIGFGRIAQATLARLVPFGFQHCLYTGNAATPPNPDADAAVAAKYGVREVRRVTLDELARESDVVFVLAPGGAATYHIVGESFLRQMKKTAVLVNAARGTLVDSDALAKALHEGWLYGAGIDVVEGEPNVGVDHPLVKAPRCVVVPHIGSATTDTRLGMATLAANNLLGGLSGKDMPAELTTSR